MGSEEEDQGDSAGAAAVARHGAADRAQRGDGAIYERKEQPLPKLGPFVAQLDKLLEANMAKPKRQRLTTKRLTEQLKEIRLHRRL